MITSHETYTKEQLNQRRHDRKDQDRRRTLVGIGVGSILLPAAVALSVAGYIKGNQALDRAVGLEAAAELAEISGSEPYKQYIAQVHDRVWNIANRAFPEDADDPGKSYLHRQVILSQLPENGILQPGDVIKLPAEADIGELVNADEPHS